MKVTGTIVKTINVDGMPSEVHTPINCDLRVETVTQNIDCKTMTIICVNKLVFEVLPDDYDKVQELWVSDDALLSYLVNKAGLSIV